MSKWQVFKQTAGGKWRQVRPSNWRRKNKSAEYPAARRVLDRLRGRGIKARMRKVEVSYPTNTHYSEHFTREELDCPCGCTTPAYARRNLTQLAADVLEPLRKKFGVAIPVLSGYRCAVYNAKIQGASRSQHLHGKAVDFNMPSLRRHGISQAKMVAALESIKGVNGIGKYPAGGVHGDIRPAPRKTWSSF